MFTAVFERFVSFRRVPMKAVIATALVSWVLQIYAFMTQQPIYMFVILAVVPWIPLALFEGLWKYEHYSWMAVFAVVAALQVLHIGEHTAQVTQLGVLDGTLACPPPADTVENAQRAVDAGLRPSVDDVTNNYATRVVVPDKTGQPKTDANGEQITGPAACGILGFLDFELVHLVWDTLVWLGALWLLTKFPRNKWLWVAMVFASIHEVEHLFLGWIYYFDTDEVFNYTRQLWGTVADGNIVTAHPVGQESVLATFYDAGGKTGILGRGGLVESLLFGTSAFLQRPYLHFGYNTLVVLPTVIAFLVQARQVRDEYLAKVFRHVDPEMVILASARAERQTYKPGEVIVRQGDPADNFNIITKGQVEVLREQANGQEVVVSRLGKEQYFGEIALLHRVNRTATVRAADDVEVMTLDRQTFGELMDASELSKEEFESLVRQRVGQLRALQTSG